MARIDFPDGDEPDRVRVFQLQPAYGEARARVRTAVHHESLLSQREREALRMRIALVNDCLVCKGARHPEYAADGVDEDLYAHVLDWPTWPGYSARERLAIEFAERFALSHHDIDDAFFDRLKEHYSDAEIVDLTFCIGSYLGFGRFTQVLRLYESCEIT